MYTWVVQLCFYIISLMLQLVYGQCILNVQLHQFDNIYNVEIRPEQTPSQFCCCDQGGDTCQTNLTAFSTTECDSYVSCDTYFVATLSECQISDPCPATLLSDVFHGISTMTDADYEFRFDLSTVPNESVWYELCARMYELVCIILSRLYRA